MRSDLGKLIFALIMVAASLPADLLCADVADDQYAVAAGHYAAERWELAVQEFTAFLKDHTDHPRSSQAMFFRGEALSQLERYPEARDQFEQLLKRDPEGSYARQALFRKAEAALLNGDKQAAHRDLSAFHEKYGTDPLDAYVLPYLGELELEGNQVTAAEKHFAEAIERFADGPLTSEARWGLARAHEVQGRRDEARRIYQDLAADKANPLADRAQFQLGILQDLAGHHADAAKTFAALTERFPRSALRQRAQLAHGREMYKLGQYAEAQKQFVPLADHAEFAAEAGYWLGLTHKAQQDWLRAATIFLAAAKRDAQHALHPALQFQAGESYLLAGQLDQASKQFDHVLTQWAENRWADDALLGKLQVASQRGEHAAAERLAEEFYTRYADSPRKPEIQFLHCTALVGLERFAEAIEPLKTCVRGQLDERRRGQCRAALVICYARSGRLDEAKKTFAELKEHHPQSEFLPSATYQLAEAAYAAGDRKSAIELFTALTATGNPPEYVSKGLSGLAWSQLQEADTAKSAATFERLLAQYPDSPLAAEAALMRGQSLEKLGQLDAALAMYHRIIEKYPQSKELPKALWLAARLHEQLDQGQDAAKLYQRLVDEHADYAQADAALYRWAWVLRKTNNDPAADALFERLRSNYPQSRLAADATFRLAERKVERQEYDAAEELLPQVLAAKPEGGLAEHALYLQGKLKMARQQWDDARLVFERLASEHPQSALAIPARYWSAEAAYRSADYEQAAERFAQLVTLCKGREEKWLPVVPLRHAQSLAHLKRWTEALKVARQIQTDFPEADEQYEVDYLIGRCLASQADFVGAREAYTRVIRSGQGGKTETAAMAQWMIGESYFHQEAYASALREYLKVDILYAYPRWQSAALLQAAKCHELLGEWSQAAELYTRLLKVYPDSEFSAEATRRMTNAQQQSGRRPATDASGVNKR